MGDAERELYRTGQKTIYFISTGQNIVDSYQIVLCHDSKTDSTLWTRHNVSSRVGARDMTSGRPSFRRDVKGETAHFFLEFGSDTQVNK